MRTIILTGLGNPGKRYEKTRHNAGFMFVDFFRNKYGEEFDFSEWEFKKTLSAEISIGKIRKEEKEKGLNFFAYAKKLSPEKKYPVDARIILLKPQTFMNLSGEAVKKAVKFYKLKSPLIPLFQRGKSGSLSFAKGELGRDFLVIAHDDIDIALGKYKIQSGASSAGHNGVQNIINQLGSKNFTRLRIGIENRDEKKIATEKYVLGKFTAKETRIISETFSQVFEEIKF